MNSKKVKISKDEFYSLGGLKNTNLSRTQIGKTNSWNYYRIIEEENMKTLKSILNEMGDMSDWQQNFEDNLSTLQQLTQKIYQVRYADEIRNNKAISDMVLHDVVNKMDAAYHNGTDILNKIKSRNI